MKIFVYEFITGGGTLCHPSFGPPAGGLLAEGRGMLEAVVRDLSAVPGTRVQVLRDERLTFPVWQAEEYVVRDAGDTLDAFRQAAHQADATLVIAPEIDDCLLHWARRAVEAGGRLLGPGLALIELASDKQRTAEFLAARGIPTPAGFQWHRPDELPRSWTFPLVAKPNWGAGCHGVKLVHAPDELAQHAAAFPQVTTWRVERYCPGQAASVSALCVGNVPRILPACSQILAPDCSYYFGAEPLMDERWLRRATELARRTLTVLPDVRGYLGMDIVFGSEENGSADYVIEINPRLTTSYLTIRSIVPDNLALDMLRA